MDYENKFEDVLGFTKQTEILLTGLGGGPEVIKEFRKRNISTDELAELNEIDLITLGMFSLSTRFIYCNFNKPCLIVLNILYIRIRIQYFSIYFLDCNKKIFSLKGADYNLITRILTELKTALKKPNENLSLQHR